jgi:hypothetical protein
MAVKRETFEDRRMKMNDVNKRRLDEVLRIKKEAHIRKDREICDACDMEKGNLSSMLSARIAVTDKLYDCMVEKFSVQGKSEPEAEKTPVVKNMEDLIHTHKALGDAHKDIAASNLILANLAARANTNFAAAANLENPLISQKSIQLLASALSKECGKPESVLLEAMSRILVSEHIQNFGSGK